MRYCPYDYQRAATEWIISNPRCALFLDMGLGKTVSTLTAIQQLMDDCEVSRTLVVAPKKVAETTWTAEAQKWDHLRRLRVAKVMGAERERIAALQSDSDIYVIGRDNFRWLVLHCKGKLPFDVMVIDELTSFKHPKSQRFKAMRMVASSMSRVIGLTGTPAPNGLIDLWGQMYCIDCGERLGKSVTRYRDTYFDVQRWNNIAVRYSVKKGCEKIIRDRIADICLSMQAKDYLQLPSLMVRAVTVELPEKVMKGYRDFERKMVLEFKESHTGEQPYVLANSAAGLMNKLMQYSNGTVYDDERNAHEIHSEKIDRLAEIVEEASGNSVLVFYQFRHDIDRIRKRLEGCRVAVYEGEQQLHEWNAGAIDVLLAHPASTAYGLNMQQGGHYIVWFGTGWDLELFQQANARLHRQGQKYPVIVYKLIGKGTVDERADAALTGKAGKQQSLMDSLNYLMRKYSDNG